MHTAASKTSCRPSRPGRRSCWVAVRAPQFGILVAKKDYVHLDRLFWSISFSSWTVAAAGFASIWAAVYALNWIGHPLANRLLSPGTAGLFLLASFMIVLTYPVA